MTRDDSRLTRVATVYNTMELATTLSYLRGYGITVAAAPDSFLSLFPYYANAVGGIPVFVPLRQARAARDLLMSVEDDAPAELPAREQDRRHRCRVSLKSILLAALHWYYGIAPPDAGRVIHRRP